MLSLSSKEVLALGELIGNEQMLVSKYKTMSEKATDPSVKSKLLDISNIHQRHYDQLKSFLG